VKRILVIAGPTASGKSKLALELARKFNGEIISADSVAVYRGFDIGSAKPTVEELREVPHHLISALEPTESFSAGSFAKMADRVIEEIVARGGVPIVCGGTGLYIRALLNGLISDEAGELDQELSQEELYERLLLLDPESASRVSPRDSVRTRRAVEFFLRTGGSIFKARQEHLMGERRYSSLILLLEPERSLLYSRIDNRVSEMLERGLVEEVSGLLALYSVEARPFGAIGYRHVVEGLRGEGLKQAIARDTRRFAKRQLTWWRNEPRKLGWREFDSSASPTELVRCFFEPVPSPVTVAMGSQLMVSGQSCCCSGDLDQMQGTPGADPDGDLECYRELKEDGVFMVRCRWS
jgi:tRNA dimethylallyltransferase